MTLQFFIYECWASLHSNINKIISICDEEEKPMDNT